MSKTLYERRGRRYYPVAEREAFDGIPHGWWLVHVVPGVRSSRRILDPAYAELEAAMKISEEAMLDAMRAMQEVKGPDTRYVQTVKERRKYERAWKAWKAIVGDVPIYFEGVSMRDVVKAGIDAVRKRVKDK